MMEPYIFLTPFEMIDIIFTLQIRDLVKKGPNQEDLVTVVFNIMDKNYSEEEFGKKMSYTSENQFGSYILADRRMWA